uniref:Myb-like domain-containing protein n=1 Tax=Oryza brachyantha TaxID=4533 RepID=J3KYJ5_ORYBR
MFRPPRARSMADGDTSVWSGSSNFPVTDELEESQCCTGYFTDLLANGVEQSQISNAINATTNEVPAIGKIFQGRGPAFSTEEDILLVSAWLNVGMDPIIGVEQSQGTMWARIHEYFHANKEIESTRSESSLLNRWSAIQHDVNVFCGCLCRIERRQRSGTRETDKMA